MRSLLFVLALIATGCGKNTTEFFSGNPVTKAKIDTLGDAVEHLKAKGLKFNSYTAFQDTPERPAMWMVRESGNRIIAYQCKNDKEAEELVKINQGSFRTGRIVFDIFDTEPGAKKLLNEVKAIVQD
jgi:formylglycine-generating enzyme required for sulfatase activity